MRTVNEIIESFGGIRALSKKLGHLNSSTVQGWKRRGVFPIRQQPGLLALAKKEKIPLKLAELQP